jgi:ADP-ribosylglycohydrolase
MKDKKLQGGLIGLLVGDALGVPYEFCPPERIPSKESIEFSPPPEFQRAHYGVSSGTWSDDGAQALCLLDSLIDCIHPARPPQGQGTGYVVDCLNSARLVLEAGNYEQVVKSAIALGKVLHWSGAMERVQVVGNRVHPFCPSTLPK